MVEKAAPLEFPAQGSQAGLPVHSCQGPGDAGTAGAGIMPE